TNAALTGLILTLSYKARSSERDTLLRIGAARGVVPLTFGLELAGLVLIGVTLAGAASLVFARVAPDVVSML
ncbi:MAG: hypothetical protein D6695_11085, partial [Planctomycetota bacterium]